jgi:hypothetical protein
MLNTLRNLTSFELKENIYTLLILVIEITGMSLATTISFAHNHSIGWATFQGPLSWVYVIYSAVQY